MNSDERKLKERIEDAGGEVLAHRSPLGFVVRGPKGTAKIGTKFNGRGWAATACYIRQRTGLRLRKK